MVGPVSNTASGVASRGESMRSRRRNRQTQYFATSCGKVADVRQRGKSHLGEKQRVNQ